MRREGDYSSLVFIGNLSATADVALVRRKVRVCAGAPPRRILTRQNLPRFSKVAIGQISLLASHPALATGTVPKLSQMSHKETIQEVTTIQETFRDHCSADVFYGGRYWDRTSGPCRVKAVLYR
jgi:hypothetical protein